MLTPSRYNFAVQDDDRVLLYCARTGAVLSLEGSDRVVLAEMLCTYRRPFVSDNLASDMCAELVRGGFLVEGDFDELGEVRRQYWLAREESPIVLTITTTMDCNLACYYCYETRTADRLEESDLPSLVAYVQGLIARKAPPTLHVDWYGGEPLLNVAFLEAASYALQATCAERGVVYHASIITNGTRWPGNAALFVERHRIRQVQVSFDGLKQNHDLRRRYRSNDGEGSSFDEAVGLVDGLVGVVRVDLRFNIDRKNACDIVPFLQFAETRGWFRSDPPVTIQPARLASYSARSQFMRNWELSVEEYDTCRAVVRGYVGKRVAVEESESPDGFPWPRSSVCAALNPSSTVIGADGYAYRCGLQVGEQNRRMERICAGRSNGNLNSLPIVDLANPIGDDREFWRDFDPTVQPNCSRCSFLPICWGGCPKKHLEKDAHALAEQGAYWRHNLARLILAGVGRDPSRSVAYSEKEQFRD